jgi:hypothetical protein
MTRSAAAPSLPTIDRRADDPDVRPASEGLVSGHGPWSMSGMSANGSAHVDVHDPASLTRWSIRLQMTESRLIEVVGRVGTMVNAVECYIGRRGYKP